MIAKVQKLARLVLLLVFLVGISLPGCSSQPTTGGDTTGAREATDDAPPVQEPDAEGLEPSNGP